MSAFVIVEVNVTDPQLFQEYAKGVPSTIAAYGGKYLVRGGSVDPKEGGWTPKRVVVLEFPSMDQARRWYGSVEYAPLLAMRLKAADSKLILVDGV
ncbi:MAG: DUF1330 domain-containing protein [Betaproteobacteria bacterium]|nr:DUF1330 domain-containing protein [Betaproteobacteria bacterium]